MNAVELREVRAVYGPYKALNGLSLTVGEREVVLVLGRNGAGKSTLARVVSGLVPVSGGEVRVLGESVRRVSPSRLARRGVVHLPEGVGLFAGLSIEENLRLRVGGGSRAIRRQRLDRALDAIGPTLRDRRHARAGQLSGGQQRLVAIAGALAAEPRLLIADEPALGLSPAAADEVYDALGALGDGAAAAIIIETRLGRAKALSERAVIMNAGTAVYDGPVDGANSVLGQLFSGRTDHSVPVAFDLAAAGELSTADRTDPAPPGAP